MPSVYAISAGTSYAQQLQQAHHLTVKHGFCTRYRRASPGRLTLVSPRAAFTIPVGTSQHLVIESQNDVSYHFGQSGDFVSNGIGHVYIINNAPQTPFKGKVIKNVPNNGLYGAGRLLVQNKGLMLWACDNPLPATIDKANATEKAVILAIAMQESDWMDARDIGTPPKWGDAENRTCLNACVGMLKKANGGSWPPADPRGPWIPAEDELRLVVGCLLRWFRGQVSPAQNNRTALKDTLNFLRGGSTAFDTNGEIHGSSLEVNTDDYLNAIASIYKELRWSANNWDDGMHMRPDPNRNGTESWDSNNLYVNQSRIWIDIPGI